MPRRRRLTAAVNAIADGVVRTITDQLVAAAEAQRRRHESQVQELRADLMRLQGAST